MHSKKCIICNCRYSYIHVQYVRTILQAVHSLFHLGKIGSGSSTSSSDGKIKYKTSPQQMHNPQHSKKGKIVQASTRNTNANLKGVGEQ